MRPKYSCKRARYLLRKGDALESVDSKDSPSLLVEMVLSSVEELIKKQVSEVCSYSLDVLLAMHGRKISSVWRSVLYHELEKMGFEIKEKYGVRRVVVKKSDFSELLKRYRGMNLD